MSKISGNLLSTVLGKNELNLSRIPIVYKSPTYQRFFQGTLAQGTTYTEYSFTVPEGCLYFTVLLVGAGGMGGSNKEITSVRYNPAGGGGSGAWARLLLQSSDFIAGTTSFKIRVGHQATYFLSGSPPAPTFDLKGGDTSFRSSAGVAYVTAEGGDTGQIDTFFKGPGDGGDVTGTFYLVESGKGEWGQPGMELEGYTAGVVTHSVFGLNGMGGTSPFGTRGYSFFKESNLYSNKSENGANAVGYGAGGAGSFTDSNYGTAGDWVYGGNGAPGFAEVTFYYQ